MMKSRFGGIVLCGGRSSRMGQPKAMLPFGRELMLQRVVRLMSEVVAPVVVVAAAEQPLPPLPPGVLVTHDDRPDRGPLEGLRAGLIALAPLADAAYLTGCDVPLLQPAFIRRMTELLESNEIVVAKEDRFHHPLAAVYSTGVIDRITELLNTDRLRPVYLFELARTREIHVDELRDVDPDLLSLRNLNHPSDYLDALALAGFA